MYTGRTFKWTCVLLFAAIFFAILSQRGVTADSVRRPSGTVQSTGVLPPAQDTQALLHRLGKGRCSDLALSPDGKTLAVAASLGIYLYDVDTLKQVDFVSNEATATGTATAIAFSPDGKLLAFDSKPDKVSLWEFRTGHSLRELDAPIGGVHSLVFSPNGELLAAGGYNKALAWRVTDGLQVFTSGVLENPAFDVAITRNGRYLIADTWDRIVVWDLRSGVEVRRLDGFEEAHGVTLAEGDTNFVYGTESGVYRYEIEQGDGGASKPLDSFGAAQLATSPDGTVLAIGNYPNAVNIGLVSLPDGADAGSLEGNIRGWVWSISFSSDGRRVASCYSDGTIRFWDRMTGAQLGKIEGHLAAVQEAVYSPDGRWVATASFLDDHISLWRSDTGMLEREIDLGASIVTALEFSQDSQFLISGQNGDQVNQPAANVWRVADGKLANGFPLHSVFSQVTSLSVSPRPGIVASGASDGTVQLWRLSDGVVLQTLSHPDGVTAIDLSGDGGLIVSGAEDGVVRIWQSSNGALVKALPMAGGAVRDVAISLDGSYVLAASADGKIHCWHLRSGDKDQVIESGNERYGSIAIDPSGRTIVAGALRGTLAFFHLEDGSPISGLTGHFNFVAALDFSPDGRRLVSGSSDGTAIIWDMGGITEATPLVPSTPKAPSTPSVDERGAGRAYQGRIIFLSSRDYPDARAGNELSPHDAYVMDPDGSRQERITQGLRLSSLNAPVASPGGESLLIGDYARNGGLRMISTEKGELYEEPLPSGANAVRLHDWSANGSKVVLTIFGESDSSSGTWNEEIAVYDPEEREFTKVTNEPKSRHLFAAFSPDDKQIAYMRDYELWIMDSDGGNQHRLIEGEARDIAWSPDSTVIAFESQEKPRSSFKYDIWLVNADGTNRRRLTQLPGMYVNDPTWSPDGKAIAFVGQKEQGTENMQIFVVDVATGAVTQITSEGNNMAPYWVSLDSSTSTEPLLDQALLEQKQALIESLSQLTVTFGVFNFPVKMGYDESRAKEAVTLVQKELDAGTLDPARAAQFRRFVLQEQLVNEVYPLAMQSSTDFAGGVVAIVTLVYTTVDALQQAGDKAILANPATAKLVGTLRDRITARLLDLAEVPMKRAIEYAVPENWEPDVIAEAGQTALDAIKLAIEKEKGGAIVDILANVAIKGPLATAMLKRYVEDTQPVLDRAIDQALQTPPVQPKGDDQYVGRIVPIYIGVAKNQTDLTHGFYEDFERAVDLSKFEVALARIAALYTPVNKWAAEVAAVGTALGTAAGGCGLHEGFVNLTVLSDVVEDSNKFIYDPSSLSPEQISPPLKTGLCTSLFVDKGKKLATAKNLTARIFESEPTVALQASDSFSAALADMVAAADDEDGKAFAAAVERTLTAEEELNQALAVHVASNDAGADQTILLGRTTFDGDLVGLYAYVIAVALEPQNTEAQRGLKEQVGVVERSRDSYRRAIQDVTGGIPAAPTALPVTAETVAPERTPTREAASADEARETKAPSNLSSPRPSNLAVAGAGFALLAFCGLALLVVVAVVVVMSRRQH